MSDTIILNSSNAQTSKNTFLYNFIGGNYKIKENSQISISNITLPYSWFNVTSAYNNKTFSFTWTVGTTTTSHNITLPDGFYTVDDINNYIQNYCITNGLYLINASGNYIYYINISYNVTAYACQLLLFPVPTSLPSGWTQPSNFAGYPTTTKALTFTLNSTGSISAIIGFSPGTYGNGGTVAQSFLSDLTPLGTNVNSIVVRCSLVNNGVTAPSDIIDSIPITSSFGSNINYVPNFEKWVKLYQGNYSSFTLSFYDQNLSPLAIRDTNALITLLIKQ